MNSDDRHRILESARTRAELSVQGLWLRYIALGGTGDAFEIDGYLQGMVALDSFQEDVLAQAANEGLEEIYRSSRVPLSDAGAERETDDRLRAAIDLLLGMRSPAVDVPDPPAATGAP